MLSLRELFRPTAIKPISTEAILDACAKTSARLNALLGTHDIEIRLAGMDDNLISEKYDQQWKGKSEFIWTNRFIPSPYHSTPPDFTLGLFKKYTLCALCRSETNTRTSGKKSLEIKTIERAQKHVDAYLKGLAITAFSEVNLEVAKSCNIPFIGVHLPRKATIPSYLRLGYKNYKFYSDGVMKRIRPNTELNLDAVLQYRATKLATASPAIP